MTVKSSPHFISGVVCREKAKQECRQVERRYETECIVCPGDSDATSAIDPSFIRNEDEDGTNGGHGGDGGVGTTVIATISCKITA